MHRVLLFDVHSSGREALASLLTEVGYWVKVAEDAHQLFALSNSVQPNIVLVDDLSLERRWELIADLRSRLPKAVILLLVTHANANGVSAAHSAGADGVLLKWPTSEKLLEVMEEKLKQKLKGGATIDNRTMKPHGEGRNGGSKEVVG